MLSKIQVLRALVTLNILVLSRFGLSAFGRDALSFLLRSRSYDERHTERQRHLVHHDHFTNVHGASIH